MRRAAIASALSLLALLGFGVYGARSDYGATKAGPPPMTEGAGNSDAPPVPGEPLATTPSPYTVPAVGARAGTTCPSGWNGFDNPVAHYSMCYPQAWGFSELRTPAPLAELRSVSLGTLHLLSPDAFPWLAGTSIFEAVVDRGATAVEIDVVPSGSQGDPANPGCTFERTVVAGTAFNACEERFEIDGFTRSVSGPIHVLRIRLPLLRAPERTQPYAEKPSALLLVVRSRASTFEEEAKLVWQLVRTIAPY